MRHPTEAWNEMVTMTDGTTRGVGIAIIVAAESICDRLDRIIELLDPPTPDGAEREGGGCD